MSQWNKVKLKEITEVITKGTTPSTYGYNFEETGEVNFIRAEGISKDGFVDESTFLKINFECDSKLKRSRLKEDDILFSIAGMALGKTGIVKQKYLPANTNQAVAIIRPKQEDIIPKYLHYQFINPQFYKKVNSISGQAAQPNINLEQVGSLEILLPPLPTQRRIASILSAYDDLIENNLKRIKLLEELAQRTYEEWFVKFRINGEPLPIDEKTGLPEGWEYRKLGSFFNVVTGKKDANYGTSDGQYPFFTCSQEPIKSPGYSFDSAAILLAGNGEFSVKIYRGKFEAYQRTYVLIPEEKKDLLLLYRSISTGLNRLTGGSKGSVIKYLTKDMIQNFEITYPSNNILEKFNSILDPLQFQLESLQAQNKHLRESRDILLPRLMSGKINV